VGGEDGDGVDLGGRRGKHPLRGGENVRERPAAAGERRRWTHHVAAAADDCGAMGGRMVNA
jgi:hypothetical protein